MENRFLDGYGSLPGDFRSLFLGDLCGAFLSDPRSTFSSFL